MSEPGDRYDSLFAVYAEWTRHGESNWQRRPRPLDWQLLKKQALAESALNPDAESPVGAQGLMQSMRATFDEWVKNEFKGEPPPHRHVDPTDPEDSIHFGADYMTWLLDRWSGDYRKALASYNWGIGNVTKAVAKHKGKWEEALPAETRQYLARILDG